jgi:hypothetical protein
MAKTVAAWRAALVPPCRGEYFFATDTLAEKTLSGLWEEGEADGCGEEQALWGFAWVSISASTRKRKITPSLDHKCIVHFSGSELKIIAGLAISAKD